MKNSVYICQLTMNDYKSFMGNNVFKFAVQEKNGKFKLPQCTVFLGDNGTGKTNLLKVIANLIPERVKVEDVKKESSIPDLHVALNIEGGKKKGEMKTMYRPHVVERHSGNYNNEINFVVYRGHVNRVSKHSFSMLNSDESQMGNYMFSTPAHIGYTGTSNVVEWDIAELDDINMYAYGVNRFSDTKRNLKSDDVVETLFSNGRPLINFEEWLLQLEIAKQDKTQRSRAQKRIEKIKEILKSNDLFPEISDYSVSFDDDMNSSVKFKTPNGDFHIHELDSVLISKQKGRKIEHFNI